MKILDDMKSQQQARTEARFETYRGLLHKAAKSPDGSLPAVDAKTFRRTVADLGFSTERVEADVATIRRATELRPLVDVLPERRNAQAEANRAAIAYDADTDRMIGERKQESLRLWNLEQSAEAAVAQAVRADDEFRELAGAHFRLLGTADPSVEARKFHLAQCVYREHPEGATYHVIALEQVMAGPRLQRIDFDNAVPLPDQPAEELARLVALARQIIAHAGDGPGIHTHGDFRGPAGDGRNVGAYVLPDGTSDPRVKAHGNVVLAPGEAAQLRPNCVLMIPAPGQSPEEFERLTSKVNRAWTKEKRTQRDDDSAPDTSRDRVWNA